LYERTAAGEVGHMMISRSGASGPEFASSMSCLYSAGGKNTGSSDRKNATASPIYVII
jgi:hypothetical protein